MIRNRINGLIMIGVLMSFNAWAEEEAIGYIKTITPKAFLTRQQKTEPATIGSPVYTGTILKTDTTGTLGVTLKDDTVLSFGPDTEFEVTDYLYHPGDEQLKLDMKLIKGTLHYISGVIAKLKPNSVNLNTPAGIIGVRGTRFVVKVDE